MAASAQTASPVHGLSAPSRAAAATALVPVALSSGLRRGIGFDKRGYSVLTTLGSVRGAPGSRVAGAELRCLAAAGGVAGWCSAAPAAAAFGEPGRARLRWRSVSALECSAASSESRIGAGLELGAPWDEALPLQAACPG